MNVEKRIKILESQNELLLEFLVNLLDHEEASELLLKMGRIQQEANNNH